MLLREFIGKYPGDSFDMMTPGGCVFLTPEQAKDLLDGKSVRAHPGNPAFAMTVDAEELLSLKILSVRRQNHVCHMFLADPEEEQKENQKEVEGMQGQDKERKLKERLKANYETYIRRLKAKPAPDLIEMASEIAAAKFIYEELEAEVLRDYWISEQSYDHHEELDHALRNMADKSISGGGFPMMEEASAGPALEQGVTMC